MTLIDTHAHLDLIIKAPFAQAVSTSEQQHIATILQQAAEQGVTSCITVGTNRHDSVRGIAYALQHSSVFASIGIHPLEYSVQWKEDIELLVQLLTRTQPHIIIAIGECGIDLYRSPKTLTEQQNLFYAQIELALTYHLPLIIHSRNAPEETFACLAKYQNEPLKGVIHCFSYDSGYAREAYGRGFVLGIGGALTYPQNHELREVVQTMPLEALVLETDAPFLPPQPWRGKANHPQHIRYIAEQISELRSVEIETVAKTTTETARALFGII